MTPLLFTRRSALRLIAAAFAFRPKIGPSLFEDTDKVNEVHSAVLEHAQRKFEEEHEREKANFKRLVVAGETACMCWHTYGVSFQAWDPAEVAEHNRLQHQFQTRFTVSKPYVVAPAEVLTAAYENRGAYPDKYWQFEEEYPGCGGTYFQLTPVRFNQKRTFAIGVAFYRCSAGFIQVTRGLWKRIGAHHWEPHYHTDAPPLDDLGFPGSPDQGLFGRLATAEMGKDYQARSMRSQKRN